MGVLAGAFAGQLWLTVALRIHDVLLQADWNIVKRGWDAHVLGKAPFKFTDPVEAIKSLRVREGCVYGLLARRVSAVWPQEHATTSRKAARRPAWMVRRNRRSGGRIVHPSDLTSDHQTRHRASVTTTQDASLWTPHAECVSVVAAFAARRAPLTTPSLTSGWTPL